MNNKPHPDPDPRPVSASVVEDYFYEVFPNDLNASATLFGGRVMEIADRVAGAICRRHCHWPYVTTVSVDRIRFLAPAYQGEQVVFRGSINRVWGSSMEIGIKVLADDFTGGEPRHIFSAYYTYVTLDRDRKPIRATPLIPETAEEKRRFGEAEKRRSYRLNPRQP